MKKSFLIFLNLAKLYIKRQVNSFLYIVTGINLAAIGVLLLVEVAFSNVIKNQVLFIEIHTVMMAIFAIDIVCKLLFFSSNIIKFLVTNFLNICILSVIILNYILINFTFTFFMSQCILIAILFANYNLLQKGLKQLKVSPTKILIIAFLFIIFIGSLLLSLPIVTKSGVSLPFLDAVFMSFSAVCVTGLSVTNIGQTFSIFGQVIILILIQVGGLGIMSFSALALLVMKQKISVADSMRMQENYTTFDLKDTYAAIKFIFQFTILFELIGMALLVLFWHKPDIPLITTCYHAIFHSISAFCNAGFSLFDNSLVDLQCHVPTILTISSLIIVGGLGFPVLFNLKQHYLLKKNTDLKLHTTLALKVTVALLVIGTSLIYIIERQNSFQGYTEIEKLLLSFFQSTSARTAGFNTIDINHLHPSSWLTLIVLMIIGASPVSTGGGIKTTTFGIIVLACWNVFKSSFRFDYKKKSIHHETILTAFSTLLVAMLLILSSSFILFFTEYLPINVVFFEIVSAFGTVGLSLSATPYLSDIGKVIIIMVMFIGRIGPFLFFYSFLKKQRKKSFTYPVEKVGIV